MKDIQSVHLFLGHSAEEQQSGMRIRHFFLTMVAAFALAAPITIAVPGVSDAAAAPLVESSFLVGVPLPMGSGSPGGPACSGAYFRSPYWYCPQGDPNPVQTVTLQYRQILTDKLPASKGDGTITLNSSKDDCNSRSMSHTTAASATVGGALEKTLSEGTVAQLNLNATYTHSVTTGNDFRSCRGTAITVQCPMSKTEGRVALLFTNEAQKKVTFSQRYHRQENTPVRGWQTTNPLVETHFWTHTSTAWVGYGHHTACAANSTWVNRSVGWNKTSETKF